jgi:hypothetical protein
MALSVECNVCGRPTTIGDVSLFMRHYVCSDCSIEDLLRSVSIKCSVCGKDVLLLNACEYKGKHACRECGISMMTARNAAPPARKKTTRFLKWLGL